MADFYDALTEAMNRGFEHLGNSPCEIYHYDVELEISHEKHKIAVKGSANCRVIKTSAIELRLLLGLNVTTENISPYTIHEMTLNGRITRYQREDFLFTIPFEREYRKGEEFQIGFAYEGIPSANKCWVNSTSTGLIPGLGDGETELCYEGMWLPFANEQFQSPTAHIAVKALSNAVVLFNGKYLLRKETSAGEYRKFRTYIPTFPTVVAGAFEVTERKINEGKISFYFQPGYAKTAAKTVETAERVLSTIAGWLGNNPVSDFTLIQLKRKTFGQYAPFPFVIFPLDDIKIDVDQNNWTQITQMLAHEIGHFWFGNLVMSRPNEQWLSEGFAQYINLLITEHFFGTEVLRSELQRYVNELNKVPINSQCTLSDIPLFSPSQPILVRLKGALILHCLRQQCGLDGFLKLLQRIIVDLKGQVISSADIEKVCSELNVIEDADHFFDHHVRGRKIYKWNKNMKNVFIES